MRNKSFQIKSHYRDYDVHWHSFDDNSFHDVFAGSRVAVIDKNVYDLYRDRAGTIDLLERVIIQEAREDLKTVESSLNICQQLLDCGFSRGEKLLVIGGGIVQDLVTFSASILFRGVPWVFVPTTLLAQSDSCLGGKSSINFGKWKNQLGNFYPPVEIHVVPEYLKTLKDEDIRSGLGEIVKVHLINGVENVNRMIENFSSLASDDQKMGEAIYRALKLKADIIEQDEFDTGLRLKMNYGHTFGHALESAKEFDISHGVAVNVGADLANYVSSKMGMIANDDYEYLNSFLKTNLVRNDLMNVDLDLFLNALKHDKKNKPGEYGLILPDRIGNVELTFVPMGEGIEQYISEYFSNENINKVLS